MFRMFAHRGTNAASHHDETEQLETASRTGIISFNMTCCTLGYTEAASDSDPIRKARLPDEERHHCLQSEYRRRGQIICLVLLHNNIIRCADYVDQEVSPAGGKGKSFSRVPALSLPEPSTVPLG